MSEGGSETRHSSQSMRISTNIIAYDVGVEAAFPLSLLVFALLVAVALRHRLRWRPDIDLTPGEELLRSEYARCDLVEARDLPWPSGLKQVPGLLFLTTQRLQWLPYPDDRIRAAEIIQFSLAEIDGLELERGMFGFTGSLLVTLSSAKYRFRMLFSPRNYNPEGAALRWHTAIDRAGHSLVSKQ